VIETQGPSFGSPTLRKQAGPTLTQDDAKIFVSDAADLRASIAMRQGRKEYLVSGIVQRFAQIYRAKNKGSRGAVDPFFSASSSRKTLADLRHSLLTGLRQKKLRAIF